MELKCSFVDEFNVVPAYQSYHRGIEIKVGTIREKFFLSINRTIVELKYYETDPVYTASQAINRTIVELKYQMQIPGEV